MDDSRFKETPFGRAARRAGDRWAFTYYLPAPLPRELELKPATVLALSEADAALGLLNGLGKLIADPEVLLGPFLTREALASSRIEGTNASLSEVLRAEGTDDAQRSDDVAEVDRYLAATRLGMRLSETLPLSQRLIVQLHAELLTGVRGDDKRPGELRSTPVWVGAASDTPDKARFVPPLPEHLPGLLSDWEFFVNEPSSLPVLVRCALMHYQFETIHPFLDGNGRIGRLLIGLMLTAEGRLSRPLLYLSGYLEAHRSDYYERLQGVREEGDVDAWLQFFFRAVKSQADDAVARASSLVELRERFQTQCRLDRSRVSALVPLLFTNPFITVDRARRAVGGTGQGARNLIDKAVDYGWLRQLGSMGKGGKFYWVADEVFRVIDAPVEY